MSSVSHSIFRFFRGPAHAEAPVVAVPQHIARRSSGLNEFSRAIAGQEGLRILDLGPTSAVNITRLTELGHKLYTEDVLTASGEPTLIQGTDNGKPMYDVPRFLAENLTFERELLDAVLCWDIPDYMPEAFVKPMVERFHSVMKPGGILLAFFHTRDAGPDAPCYRYHLTGNDMLDLQPGPRFRLQRIFNNRHIENLFRDFASLKFFLARDNVREVLVVR
jgi:SAM-dependent methyltransferase